MQQKEPLTSEQRKAILDRQIDNMFAGGYRVSSRTDTAAVMAKGKKINHLLHFFVGVFTGGLWWIVWLFLGLTGGERETRIWVDESGELTQTSPQRVGSVNALLFLVPLAGIVLLGIVLLVVGAVSLWLAIRSDDSPVEGPGPIPTSRVTATSRSPAISSAPRSFSSPATVIDATKPYVATLKTNKGDIQITLATDTPQAVNSFAFLAAERFYDGTAFFYIDHKYWAQAGDPDCRTDSTTTCTGNTDAGFKLPIEKGALKNVKFAVVAPVVQGGELVSGGQFRILFSKDSRLDGTETVFGTVTKGQDILEAAPDFLLCTALSALVPGCATDLSNALIIDSVVVEPAS